jgi:hypothetical protein
MLAAFGALALMQVLTAEAGLSFGLKVLMLGHRLVLAVVAIALFANAGDTLCNAIAPRAIDFVTEFILLLVLTFSALHHRFATQGRAMASLVTVVFFWGIALPGTWALGCIWLASTLALSTLTLYAVERAGMKVMRNCLIFARKRGGADLAAEHSINTIVRGLWGHCRAAREHHPIAVDRLRRPGGPISDFQSAWCKQSRRCSGRSRRFCCCKDAGDTRSHKDRPGASGLRG